MLRLSVTFTGRLTYLTHNGAEALIRELGGYNQKKFSYGDTQVLVVGRLPKSGPTEALQRALRTWSITILDESDFIQLVPPEILLRHHRDNGTKSPSPAATAALTTFHENVAADTEAYRLRCVRDFIADKLPAQKTIELDSGTSFNPNKDFEKLCKLVAPVVHHAPRNSAAVKEVRETLAKRNLKLAISSAVSGVALDGAHNYLRFQVINKRRFLLEANQFMKDGRA